MVGEPLPVQEKLKEKNFQPQESVSKNRNMKISFLLLLSTALAGSWALTAQPEDAKEINFDDMAWSQWRGPTRDGFVKEGAPWPDSIAEDKLKLVWRKEINKGYPGPIVSEKLVFTVETRDAKDEVV